jgi:hypothetical protein
VNLTAGNLVQHGASSSALPRVDALKVPMIYPGILNISAGAGGVLFDGDSFYNQLILFPSPQGALTIDVLQRHFSLFLKECGRRFDNSNSQAQIDAVS